MQQNGAGSKAEEGTGQLKHFEGKYLTFALGGEIYGFNILRVSEIIGVIPITTVPRTHAAVRGVVNLRGKIVPVLDLRLRFGIESRPYDRETCIVVTEVHREDRQLSIGMVVDTVLAVQDFHQSGLAAVPEYGAAIDTKFIQAVGSSQEERPVILLDVDRIIGETRFGVTGKTL